MKRLALLGLLLLALPAVAQTTFAVDGLFNEPRYRLLSTNAGGPAPSFGTGNQLTALYGHVDRASNALYIGVGGNIGSGNRIIVFLDSRPGGYTGGNYAQGSGVPSAVNNFNQGTTFNPDFTADFAIGIGTDGTSYFVNVTELGGARTGGAPAGAPSTTTDRYFGCGVMGANCGAPSPNVAASVATTTTDYGRGFEIRIPFSTTASLATATPIQVAQPSLQFFAVVSGDGGDGFLSNSFLSPAPASQTGNVGAGAQNFSAVGDRDPVSLVYQYPADVARYRLLSPPVTGYTVANLATMNLVQGVTGQYPTASPNVYLSYTGTYVPATSTANAIPSGSGFFWQLYDQDITPQPGAFGGGTSRSYELSAFALEAGGTPLRSSTTYTPAFTAPSGGSSFYMIGNPFASPLLVDGVTKTGGDGTLVTTLQAFNAANGSYQPLLSGTSTYLATWQGVFAEVSGTPTTAPTFSYNYGSVSTTATPTFYGRPTEASYAHLTLTGTTEAGAAVTDDAAYVRLLPDALDGWDRDDASKLTPPAGPYALLAPVTVRDGAAYRTAVTSLPADGAQRTVPLAFLATDAGTYTLTWDATGTAATLRDLATGALVDLAAAQAYTFTSAASGWTERFELVLGARGATAGETGAPAEAFRVLAARPNPVRGLSEVTVELGAPQHVRAVLVDALGRRVRDVYDAPAPAGALALRLDAAGLAPGVYVLRVSGDSAAATQTITIVR